MIPRNRLPSGSMPQTQATDCQVICSTVICGAPGDATCGCGEANTQNRLDCYTCLSRVVGDDVVQLKHNLDQHRRLCARAGHPDAPASTKSIASDLSVSGTASRSRHHTASTSAAVSTTHSQSSPTPVLSSSPTNHDIATPFIASAETSSTTTAGNEFSPSSAITTTNKPSNTAAIAGGVAAAVAVVLAILAFWIFRKRRRPRRAKDTFRVLHLDDKEGRRGFLRRQGSPTPFIGGDALMHSRMREEHEMALAEDGSNMPLLAERQYSADSTKSNMTVLATPSLSSIQEPLSYQPTNQRVSQSYSFTSASVS